MKTLYLTQSSENIVVDPETDFVGKLNSEDRYSIRSVYYMEEPMHIVYQCGEVKEELDARKGDIVLVFYSNTYNKYTIDTIRTKQWAANIRNEHAMRQKEKEEWAAKKASCDCDTCCETCSCGANLAEIPVVNAAPEKENIAKKIKKALKKVTKK
jgi:hypothetical protein